MDEENVKNIQKFLIAQLSLTPRRRLFEDYLIEKETGKIKNSTDFEKVFDDGENFESESIENNQWKSIKHLREFRQNHAKECINQVNQQKFSRAVKREADILNRSNYFKRPPSTEELIMQIEHERNKESIRSRFNALNFHQKHETFK